MANDDKIETQIIKVVKEKDDFRVSIKISENAKGEASATVISRSDDADEAIKVALDKYQQVVQKLRNMGVKTE